MTVPGCYRRGGIGVKIRMQLLSDAIFGNGMSIPGGEDISVLCDAGGFPYYKGGTFKGIFRETMEQYLEWTGRGREDIRRLLGVGGDDTVGNGSKLVFSDFQLSDYVKTCMLEEIGEGQRGQVLGALTHIRVFTAISEDGIVREGSLRRVRCINKGLNFYSEIKCGGEDKEMVSDILSCIKWIGTMRNRGFGKVSITVNG